MGKSVRNRSIGSATGAKMAADADHIAGVHVGLLFERRGEHRASQ